MGHRGLHRRHRDEHPHLHRRARARLQRRLDVPPARDRLHPRALPDLGASSCPPTSAARSTPRTSCCRSASAAPCARRRPRIFLLYRTLGDGIRLHAAALVLAVAAGVPHYEWIVHRRAGRGHDPVHRGGRRHGHHLDRHHPDVRVPGRRARVPGRGRSACCPMGVGGRARRRPRPRASCTCSNLSLDLDAALHALGGRRGRRVPDPGHARHGPLPRAAPAGGAQPARRRHRPRALGLPGHGPVRAVPVPGHAALGALRRAALRARGRGAADVRLHRAARAAGGLHPGRHRGGGALAVAQLDGVRDRARLLPALRPAGADERAADARGRACSRSCGASLQIGVAVLAQNVDSALQAGLAALGYASGPTVGAFLLGVLSAARAHGRHDDRHDRRARRQPVGRHPRAVPLRRARRRLDLERRGGRGRHGRGRRDREPADGPRRASAQR